MATDNLPEQHKEKAENAVLDLIPRMVLFAGEDALSFEDLRQAFLLDLAPSSPYEITLAENLVALEWEVHRHRRIRDSLLRTQLRKFAEGTFEKGEVGTLGYGNYQTEEGSALTTIFLDRTSENHGVALRWLQDQGIDPGELLAAAYKSATKSLEPHERKLAELEIRRRRLREDFDRLKAVATPPIEDATLLPDK
ncbi:hypothetical protein [Primorskyibacter sp. S87]|uniref:hypothetical protein n=1 Tax=Primorskyibacter sp. S87 TaxID=3415126 RepID=UPI003C7B12DE